MASKQALSRRNVLKTLAMGASATWMPFAPHTLFGAAPSAQAKFGHAVSIPDDGWRLWVDDKAPWQSDEIFLPDDVAWAGGALCGGGQPLPVHEPTGGWSMLSTQAGLAVTLPSSVEQHFWGKYGAGSDGRPRPYTPEEYRYAATTPPVPPADDNVPQNGAYFGVSWFYRHIDVPASMRGQRILLHIRGAHLRAEVYCNGKLCGYSIMEELPFEADLTHAAVPGGDNLLAIRITNPFGRFDWVDGLNAKWGKVALYRSHGFGALDRELTLTAHAGDTRIADLWVLNTPEPTHVVAYARLEGPTQNGPLRFDVLDAATGHVLASAEATSGAVEGIVQASLAVPSAALWDIGKPKLYTMRATLAVAPRNEDIRSVTFGFRSFGPSGLGSKAIFRINGRRIRIYTAISWGFWGLNGMFPVPELAVKEVRAAQELGLNCLNFHRNLAKEDVLRQHDELGVLRYMEPGAGKLAIGKLPANVQANAADIVMEAPKDAADRFAQKFMFAKCVAMVKAFRSHPSVIEYCLQNEIGADLKNPATLAVLKAMHDQDPSRVVVLNDGFVAAPRNAAQAWYEPWSNDLKSGTLHRSDQEKAGDWWNNHQGAGDQWYDHFYKSPEDYTYKAPFQDVLTEYGEMEGCARPDNHVQMVQQIEHTFAKYGGTSYDLVDHKEIIAGYEQFLDRWGFRKAFASADQVFLAVGKTCYDSWMNYMENARISDELDFAAISGWESTAIENHSGIVDNLRNFKSDPALIRGSLLPVRPIAKQRTLTVERGKPAVFDFYLADDTPSPATGTLSFAMTSPSGKHEELISVPAPPHVVDQFSYLLKIGYTTPPLTEEGLYRFTFSLSSLPLATQTKELWVTAGAFNSGRSLRVAVSGVTPELKAQLAQFITVSDYTPGERYDLLISSGMPARGLGEQKEVGETTGEQMPTTKRKPGNEHATAARSGQLAEGIVEAVRNGTPLLAIPDSDALSDGVARELAAAGAFIFHGNVGDFRAPWMGNWYFVREHPLFTGMPVNQAMGGFYQAPGRQSNGLLIERAEGGPEVDVVVAYSRDHDRKIGAGTFTSRVGAGKVVFHRVPPMHPVMQQRFLANALRWLTA